MRLLEPPEGPPELSPVECLRLEVYEVKRNYLAQLLGMEPLAFEAQIEAAFQRLAQVRNEFYAHEVESSMGALYLFEEFFEILSRLKVLRVNKYIPQLLFKDANPSDDEMVLYDRIVDLCEALHVGLPEHLDYLAAETEDELINKELDYHESQIHLEGRLVLAFFLVIQQLKGKALAHRFLRDFLVGTAFRGKFHSFGSREGAAALLSHPLLRSLRPSFRKPLEDFLHIFLRLNFPSVESARAEWNQELTRAIRKREGEIQDSMEGAEDVFVHKAIADLHQRVAGEVQVLSDGFEAGSRLDEDLLQPGVAEEIAAILLDVSKNPLKT